MSSTKSSIWTAELGHDDFYGTQRQPVALTRKKDTTGQFPPDLENKAFETSVEPVRSFSSRNLESYSRQEIYGTASESDVNLRRSATRNTILDELLRRVSVASRVSIDDRKGKSMYETLPDHAVPSGDAGAEFSEVDPELVTWDGADDPENPRNWSYSEKIFQTVIVALYTLISPMSSSILSPAMGEIGHDLHMNSTFMKSFSVSIMVLAWALGPLLIAPLLESDRVGRRPVLNVLIWVIAAFNLGCGFVKTPAQLCVLRFLGGLSGCAPLNVGAGTLADMWSDKQRQLAMAAYSLGPTLGPILAPIISSFILTGLNWHWCFYILTIFNAAVAAFGLIFFKETYTPRLLATKAEKLKKKTGNPLLHTIYQIADGETTWGRIYITILRPLMLLFGHPMVIGLGVFMAFTYGFMYLFIVTFPDVFRGSYGFSVNISGLMYLGLGIGFILGTIFWSVAIEWFYNDLTRKNGGVPKPEYRLPCLCFCGVGIPVGLVWYGWLAQKKLHWIMPCIGSGIFGFSLVAVFQTIQNYLIDMNNRFAASSVAAAAVFRSTFGFGFPLFAHAMYDRLNYGWGNTMCAFIALALGVPFPVFCLIYGEKLREWANRRFDRKQALRDQRNLRRLQQQADSEREDTKSDESKGSHQVAIKTFKH